MVHEGSLRRRSRRRNPPTVVLHMILLESSVSQVDKLLQQIRANPRAVRFTDLARVLEAADVTIRSGKGSHRVALRSGVVYTIKDPGSGQYVHPKSVKHCLQAFGLWD